MKDSPKSDSFCNIKVVGISGAGKTVTIRAIIKQSPDIKHICFSEYLKKYGHLVSQKILSSLKQSGSLVLMDEHLEIGEDDLSLSYTEENTIGIFVIEASPKEILNRRRKDKTRTRCENFKKIVADQNYARQRAINLSIANSIPILIIRNGSINENVELLNAFISIVWRK